MEPSMTSKTRAADVRHDDGSTDEDEALTQTQVAAPPPLVPSPSSPPPTDVIKCVLCAMNLSAWSILEREMHLNACLDAKALEQQSYECPTCGKELTAYNEARRMAHVNMCLDRTQSTGDIDPPPRRPSATTTEETATPAPAVVAASAQYYCPICGLNLELPSLEARSRHVKQCGQRFGVRAADLAPSTAPNDTGELTDVDSTASASATATDAAPPPTRSAFAVLMQSSRASSAVTTAAADGTTRTSLVSNAFDVLMKSSKTQAVLEVAAQSAASVRSFWRPSATSAAASNNQRKRPRPSGTFGAPASGSHTERRRYGCPDFKRILGTQPPFIVDGFRFASKGLSSVYFLTHFHSDHYTGLQRSFDCGIIYCNHVTAALVVQELGLDPKFVHPVPMNTPVDVHGVQVTFMDANHCPGAAIILFRLRSGRTYLHTGDFRFHPKMWKYGPLQPFVQDPSSSSTASSRRLDGVYLDTTYADPKYTFPTQQASIDHALGLVDKHLRANGIKTLFLFGSYSVGKERLFMDVAERFDVKICVSKAKFKMISTFGWPSAQMKLLTTEPSATSFHVVPMSDLKLDHLHALLQKHRLRFHEVVAFRPTGWTFSRSHASMSTCQSDPSGKVRIYGIPYSEHSSFAELCEFIRVLNPHAIIPTVNCHSEKAVRKQLDLIRQSAFHSIASMFQAPDACPST